MKTLNLETPQQSRLEQNAQPHLAAILSSVSAVRTACGEFNSRNDNRQAIRELYEDLGKHVEALSDANDRDQEQERLGAAYSQAINLYKIQVSSIARSLRSITPSEEGTRLPARKLQKAFKDLSTAVNAFDERNDTRPSALMAVTEMRKALAEIMLLDLELDPWLAKAVTDRLDGLASNLALTVTLPSEPAPARMQNTQRLNAIDAAYNLKSRTAATGYRYFEVLEENKPIVAKIDALRDRLGADIFTPIEDVEAIFADVQAIRSDIGRLANVYVPQTASPQLLQNSVKVALIAADALLAILGPQRSITPPAPTLFERFRDHLTPAFGWEN